MNVFVGASSLLDKGSHGPPDVRKKKLTLPTSWWWWRWCWWWWLWMVIMIVMVMAMVILMVALLVCFDSTWWRVSESGVCQKVSWCIQNLRRLAFYKIFQAGWSELHTACFSKQPLKSKCSWFLFVFYFGFDIAIYVVSFENGQFDIRLPVIKVKFVSISWVILTTHQTGKVSKCWVVIFSLIVRNLRTQLIDVSWMDIRGDAKSVHLSSFAVISWGRSCTEKYFGFFLSVEGEGSSGFKGAWSFGLEEEI